MTVGRNAPCPCGSGKKYKKCCMLADQAASDQTTPRLINRASEEAAELLAAHAQHTRGPGYLERAWRLVWSLDERPYTRDSPFNALIVPWALYLWDGGDEDTEGLGSVAEDFLATPMVQGVADRTLRFMEACRSEPLTFWQAQAVEPGSGMTVRDMVTGRECFVHERSATRTIVPWDLVFGQVVEVDGINTLSMSGPYPLPAARFRQGVEQFLAEEVEAEHLLEHDEALIDFYLDCVEELLHPTMPEMRNMDGDRLEWTTSTYRFAPDQRGRLLGRLDQMRNIEADETEGEDEAGYSWIGHRTEGPMERVHRGRLTVGGETLVTECNSRKRDRALRERLLKNLGDLLEHEETTHKPLDTEAMRAAAEGERPPAPGGAIDPATLPPEAQAQIQRMMDDMHMRWADESVPALGGQTPREAVKTAEGRREVAQLLNDFQNRQRRSPNPQDRFDFNRLRRELGLEEE